jgi:hypothetical protein
LNVPQKQAILFWVKFPSMFRRALCFSRVRPWRLQQFSTATLAKAAGANVDPSAAKLEKHLGRLCKVYVAGYGLTYAGLCFNDGRRGDDELSFGYIGNAILPLGWPAWAPGALLAGAGKLYSGL